MKQKQWGLRMRPTIQPLTVFLSWLLIASPAFGAPTVTATLCPSQGGTADTSYACTIPATSTGDLLFACFGHRDSGLVSSITGATFALTGSMTGQSGTYESNCGYAANVASGITTITGNFNSSVRDRVGIVYAITGMVTSTPADQIQSLTEQTTNTGTLTGASVTTTTTNGSVTIGWIIADNTLSGTAGGFTSGGIDNTGGFLYIASSYRIDAGTGTYTPSWSATGNTHWGELTIDFKQAAGSTPAPIRHRVIRD